MAEQEEEEEAPSSAEEVPEQQGLLSDAGGPCVALQITASWRQVHMCAKGHTRVGRVRSEGLNNTGERLCMQHGHY